jgi:hypothetical protein
MGENRRSPTKIILWVLTGCVAFVVVGFWVTRPRSDAEEWVTEADDDRDVGRTHDTFEDAWKEVWKDGKSSRKSDDASEVVRPAKPTRRAVKTSTDRPEETRRPEDGSNDTALAASPEVESDEVRDETSSGSPNADPSAVDTELASNGESSAVAALAVATSTTPAPSTEVITGATTAETVRPVAKVASRRMDLDEDLGVLQPVESRVVTLRLTGTIGGQRMDPKDGYAWGRIAYFLQRERKPPYFLVFPGGGISSVMGPPAADPLPGVKRTVQGQPSMRPRGKLGPPLFAINITATVESAGTMTFYGRGIAQKYVCRLNAQVTYVGGEKSEVVDSFTVTERSTAVQGRAAAGPPGSSIYQGAVEKLITRLRATTYFR